jgi:hypothetical protein
VVTEIPSVAVGSPPWVVFFYCIVNHTTRTTAVGVFSGSDESIELGNVGKRSHLIARKVMELLVV